MQTNSPGLPAGWCWVCLSGAGADAALSPISQTSLFWSIRSQRQEAAQEPTGACIAQFYLFPGSPPADAKPVVHVGGEEMNVRAGRLATSQVILPKCGFGFFFLLNTEESSQHCFLRTCLRGCVQADLCLPCLHSELPGSHPQPILEATYTHWHKVVPRLTALPLGRAWNSPGVLHKALGLEMFCIQPPCSIQETYGDKPSKNILFSSLLFIFVQAFRETI